MAKKKAIPLKKKKLQQSPKSGIDKKVVTRKKSSSMPVRGEGSIRFEGILEVRTKMGGGHFIPVPPEVTVFFGVKGRTRVLGTLNGVAIDRALIPDGLGGHEIIVGTEVRKKTKAVAGSKVVIEIYRNPNPDEINIPEELLAAIEMEPEAVRKFEKMTAGMKRNMAYWVDSGKLPETRAKRAVEVLNRILTGGMFGGKKLE